MKKILLIPILALSLGVTAHAQVLIHGNDLTGTSITSSTSAFGTGAVNHPDITGGNIRNGGGLNSETANGQYEASAWSNALNTGDYFQVFINLGAEEVDFSSFEFTGLRSTLAFDSVTIRTSVDSYASDFATGVNILGDTVSLASLANQTGNFGIRVYALGSTNSGQTYAIGDYAVNGTVIPEPSTYALLAGCLALGAVMVRRRK